MADRDLWFKAYNLDSIPATASPAPRARAGRHGVEPFEVGRDSISSVTASYKSKMPFAFTGTIEKRAWYDGWAMPAPRLARTSSAAAR
jgi:hypothetical protein